MASRRVRVEVRDSGPGIEPERAEQLFEPFYTTKPQGIGMGLWISRSIIEAHQGSLWATANVPHGAVFQFSLPVEQSAQARARGERGTRANLSRRQRPKVTATSMNLDFNSREAQLQAGALDLASYKLEPLGGDGELALYRAPLPNRRSHRHPCWSSCRSRNPRRRRSDACACSAPLRDSSSMAASCGAARRQASSYRANAGGS